MKHNDFVVCKNCLDDTSNTCIFQCSNNEKHIFCPNCHPDLIAYDISQKEKEENPCPACHGKTVLTCQIGQSLSTNDDVPKPSCHKNALNTKGNGWFQCSGNDEHAFCISCNPITINYDIDDEKKKRNPCPSCHEMALNQCYFREAKETYGLTHCQGRARNEKDDGWYKCTKSAEHKFCFSCVAIVAKKYELDQDPCPVCEVEKMEVDKSAEERDERIDKIVEQMEQFTLDFAEFSKRYDDDSRLFHEKYERLRNITARASGTIEYTHLCNKKHDEEAKQKRIMKTLTQRYFADETSRTNYEGVASSKKRKSNTRVQKSMSKGE